MLFRSSNVVVTSTTNSSGGTDYEVKLADELEIGTVSYTHLIGTSAFGYLNNVSGNESVAFGFTNTISAAEAVAMGRNNQAVSYTHLQRLLTPQQTNSIALRSTVFFSPVNDTCRFAFCRLDQALSLIHIWDRQTAPIRLGVDRG